MTSGVLDPAELPRRSPVYRELKDAGARFVESYGGAVAEDFDTLQRQRGDGGRVRAL